MGLASRGMLWLFALLSVPGCSEEWGSDRPRTARVVGVVRDGGQPVSGGWIEFLPIDGTVGRMRSSPIGSDGTFAADRVPVGTVRVGLEAVRTSRTDPHFCQSLGSPIRREIPADGLESLTIDLTEELIRFQAEIAASRR